MTRHDEAALWDYASRDLDPDEARVVEDHLSDCPECREQLAAVHVAREALETARDLVPQIDWARHDEAIGSVVEARLAAQARRPMLLRLFVSGALVAAAAGLAFFMLNRVEPPTQPAPVALEAPLPPSVTARVDRASGLSREGSALLDGATLASGDVLETTSSGRAFVHLPDLSHARLGPGSKLTLSRAEVDDVTLTLASGHLAVRASHQDRKGFSVQAGGLTVHVVGTVFVVTNSPEAAEVAVSEGRVAVEFVNGISEFVDAGTRLRIDRRGRVTRGLKVPGHLLKELDEVVAVADTTTAVETQAVAVAAAGGRGSAPPLISAQGAPRTLPRLDPAQARGRQVTLPPEALGASTPALPVQVATEAPVTQRLEPKTELIVEAPAAATQAPGAHEDWAALPKAPANVSPEEWAPLPQTQQPAPAVTSTPRTHPRDLESQFLEKAIASIESGACERFLSGLEDLAIDAQKTDRTENARVLRARCFAVQLRPRQAVNEYRKYLEEYPRGRYVSEATDAVGQ